MLKSILKLSGIKQLKKSEQKFIVAGFTEEYLCSCNGHTLGTATSSSGCVAQCYACVSNGRCEPFA